MWPAKIRAKVSRAGKTCHYRKSKACWMEKVALCTLIVAKTATFDDGELIQTGCGLNFEGGRLTLCTCKRRMRTYPGVDKGAWIAVFASGADGQEYAFSP